MGDLTGSKNFESEVRFLIPNIDKFLKRVEDLKLKLIRKYSFTDYYFKPNFGPWDSLKQSLRIRVWRQPKRETAIYLTSQEVKQTGKYSFKRSLYPEGKRILFTGLEEKCREVLDDLGFKQVYKIEKKQGLVWQDLKKGLEFCAEETDLFGWTGEIELEGINFAEIKKILARHQQLLQLTDEQITFKSVALIIEEKLGLLKTKE